MRMRIGGLQKVTLLDYPGKVACTVFLPGCNLRCPFCHNPALVLPDRATGGLSTEKLLAFLETRRGKLDGVCVTGGEPTLYEDLPALLRQIRALGFAVKLDTNGCDPARLAEILNQGLVDYVAMDVKNAPARYTETVGIPGFNPAPVEESIRLLRKSTVDYEFRTTVVRQFHDSASFRAIGPWISGARRYFLQAFIDRDTVLRPGLSAWSREEMEGFAALVRPWVPAVELRGI